MLGDFTALPTQVPTAQAAFAVEAFVHASSAERFFRECSRVLEPGARLIVCDDFLSEPLATFDSGARRWLDEFAYGWHINTLLSLAEADELARAAGFQLVERVDLSPFLELGRPRDRAIAAFMLLAPKARFSSTYWRMLQGGNALQACLRRGWLKYLFGVWLRT